MALGDVPQKNRGGQGVALLKTNEGDRLIALHVVGSGDDGTARHYLMYDMTLILAWTAHRMSAALTDGEDSEEVLLGSAGGMLSRIPLSSIKVYGRNAKGVGVLRLQARSSNPTCSFKQTA